MLEYRCTTTNLRRHNGTVIVLEITLLKAIPHVYDMITENFFRSSYLHLFTSNLLLLPLVKYSPVAFFGNVTATC